MTSSTPDTLSGLRHMSGHAHAEIQRSDIKAAALCGGATAAIAALSLLFEPVDGMPFPAWPALGCLCLSFVLAVAALRPALPCAEKHAGLRYLDYSAFTPAQTVARLAAMDAADVEVAFARQCVDLSALTLAKLRLVRASVDLLICGVALACVTLAVGA